MTYDDSYLFVALGYDPTRMLKKVVGVNWDVGTSFEDIWAGGANLNWPQAAQKLEIISSDAADDYGSGDNAWVVRLCGLNENWELIKDIDVQLQGLSASAQTTEQFIRVLDARVIQVGSYGASNKGTLTIRGADGSTLFGKIGVSPDGEGTGQLLSSAFTIPANWTGFFLGGTVYVAAAKPASVEVKQRLSADVVSSPFGGMSYWVTAFGIEGPFAIPMKGPSSPIPSKTDLWAAAKGDSVTSKISIEYELLLVANSVLP